MEILLFDAKKSKNCGYFAPDGDGIKAIGLDELIGKNVRFSELDGSVILANDDEEIPIEETIPFTELNLHNPNVVKYLRDRGAIGCLFVKIFGIWSQTDVHILQNHIQMRG